MTPDESELELYTTALRGDMPNASDEARVRKLLAEAGVLASSVAAPGMALGAATAGGGVAAKLAALPVTVKLGGALVLAGLVATPVVRHATSDAPRPAVKTVPAEPAPARTAIAARSVNASAPRAQPLAGAAPASQPLPAAVVAPAIVALVTAGVEPARSRAETSALRASELPVVQAEPSAAARGTAASLAVMAFEVAPPSPPAEGTLRAETALIERALTALRRGDSATARGALAEHSARFPEGQLVRERERALAKVVEKETSHDSK